MSRAPLALVVLAGLVATAAGAAAQRLTLRSPAFETGGPLADRHTCAGAGVSPPLAWEGVPSTAKSLALVVLDADAPADSRVHWVLYDLPPEAGGLREDAERGALPARARVGENDWRQAGWRAPCPEEGRDRRFVFRLYALDVALGDHGAPSQPELEALMSGHILARADLGATTRIERVVETDRMRLLARAFDHREPIPARYTCDGRGGSPALAWEDLPAGTRSLALVVLAPDAQASSRVHWVVYDLPPGVGGLRRGARGDALPPGAREGENDWGEVGWRAPCPPTGEQRYVFRLYALDVVLGDLGTPTQPELEAALSGHVLARADLVGTYQKRGGL